MFAKRYFCNRGFAPRYFAKVGAASLPGTFEAYTSLLLLGVGGR
jgi:hypothetical protein